KLTAVVTADTERHMAAKAGATGKLTIMKKTADGAIADMAKTGAGKGKGKVAQQQAAKIVAAAKSAGAKVVKKK
ncbi:hypothetical protein HDV05_002323, partial [Chytridiales sp. JEL 0842]